MKTYTKSNNKYYNKPVSVDNIVFASKDESRRYKELKALEQAGKIENLCLQVPYEVIPKQVQRTPRYHKRTGKPIKDDVKVLEQNCIYVADFVYFDKEKNTEIVEDVKGYRDSTAYQVFAIKRKLMLHIYGIQVQEINYHKKKSKKV